MQKYIYIFFFTIITFTLLKTTWMNHFKHDFLFLSAPFNKCLSDNDELTF